MAFTRSKAEDSRSCGVHSFKDRRDNRSHAAFTPSFFAKEKVCVCGGGQHAYIMPDSNHVRMGNQIVRAPGFLPVCVFGAHEAVGLLLLQRAL